MNRFEPNRHYNRPNQTWVCTAKEGCGCPSGPTSGGKCRYQSQCNPVQQGDLWKCNRPEIRGGTCELGPDPSGKCCFESRGCVPRRSLRSYRKVFVVCCISLVTGLLLLNIWGPDRNEFFAPGPLSANHAQIWNGEDAADRCNACHAAGSANPISWLRDALSGGSHIGQPQYAKCLNCHRNSIPEKQALLVHNLAPSRLAEIRASIDSGTGNHALIPVPVSKNGELACANCHREHHGADHDLTHMTNQQCQSCHAQQFADFEHGHPEFRKPLFRKRNNIAFDHYTHQSKHFVDAKTGFDCNSCHESGTFGNVMKLKPFEVSCGSCHAKKIDASLTQGLPIFQLPSVDTEYLKAKGFDIGSWPQALSGSFDGGLPPVMKLLLASDERAVEAMKVLGPDFDLFDIDPGNPDHLQATYDLVLATKSLLLDLSQKGQVALVDRLESISQREISRDRLYRMLNGLGPDTFSAAQQRWFPNLESEDINRNGQPTKHSENGPPGNSTNGSEASAQRKSNRVAQASFLQQVPDAPDRSILAENPLKSIYQQKPTATGPTPGIRPASKLPESPPSQNDSRDKTGQQLPRIEFQDLPTEPANPAPAKKITNPHVNSPSAAQQNDHTNPTTPPSDPAQENLAANPLKPLVNRQDQPADRPFQELPEKIANQSAQPVQDTLPAPQQKSNPKIDPDRLLAENPLSGLLHKSAAETPESGAPNDPNDPLKKKNEKGLQTVDHEPGTSQNPETDPSPPSIAESPKNLITDSANGDAELAIDPPGSKPIVEKNGDRTADLLPPSKRVELGGLYRDDELFLVAYRQTGHADPLTTQWYDFVTSLDRSRNDAVLGDFHQLLSNKNGAGLCASCHSIDAQDGQRLKFNWRAEFRDINKRDFTRFSHRPHLIQPGTDRCSTCHQINPQADIMSAYESNDASRCQSGFYPINKSNCTTCHNRQSGVDHCTQCHNYHVGAHVIRR